MHRQGIGRREEQEERTEGRKEKDDKTRQAGGRGRLTIYNMDKCYDG